VKASAGAAMCSASIPRKPNASVSIASGRFSSSRPNSACLGEADPDQAARWLLDRRIIGVGDASFASIDLLNNVRPWLTMITRLRLNAARDRPTPRRLPGKVGRPSVVGKRLASAGKGNRIFGAC
jgi:hypothetical protein